MQRRGAGMLKKILNQAGAVMFYGNNVGRPAEASRRTERSTRGASAPYVELLMHFKEILR